jgi:transposase
MSLHRGSEASRRLAEIPGIGPVGATDWLPRSATGRHSHPGRSLAAWIGLVPKQHSAGGKDRLGSITKQGNRYLRWLLVVGAMAVIRYARKTCSMDHKTSGRVTLWWLRHIEYPSLNSPTGPHSTFPRRLSHAMYNKKPPAGGLYPTGR